jgi:hypothetical protein
MISMKPSMRTILKILVVYTLASAVFNFLTLILWMKPYQTTNWLGTAIPLIYSIPLIVFATMVLFGIRSGTAKKVLYVLAGYTLLLFLFVLIEMLIPPLDWYRIVVFLFDLPVLALAGLVLFALRRGTIMNS